MTGHHLKQPFSIFPLGDAAITIDLGNAIEESLSKRALAIQNWLVSSHFSGILDIIAAYSSVTVFYDPVAVRKEAPCLDGAFACMRQRLEMAWEQTGGEAVAGPEAAGVSDQVIRKMKTGDNGNVIRIPVCYEGVYAPDLERLSREKGLTPEEVIHLHVSRVYRVYMIGFLPGFPYLGRLDERLQTPRKQRPVPVKAGGVGIAGNQTGIYSLNSPGGWQIIGRTPEKLFNPASDNPVRLKIGDSIVFFPITGEQFRDLELRE